MELQTVSLGPTGLQVSELALGTARFGAERDDGTEEIDREAAHDLLDAYADAGGNFIDTADVYGDGRAESYIGDWLADRDREEFVVASKIYWPAREGPNGGGLNRKHLRRQIDRILNRLGTDYLDMLYIHRWDDATQAEEFMRTLDGFVRDGRVNYLGASTREPNAWRVVKANELADRRGYELFTNAQVPYNLVDRTVEREYLSMVRDYDLGLMAFSPLAGGFLAGKYERGEDPPAESRGAREQLFRDRYFSDENFTIVETVAAIAEETDASPVEVSLAWLLAHEDVTAPVVGPRTVDQLESNLAAANLHLSASALDRLGAAATATDA